MENRELVDLSTVIMVRPDRNDSEIEWPRPELCRNKSCFFDRYSDIALEFTSHLEK